MTTIKLLTQFSFNNATMTKLGGWLIWSAIFVATLAVGPQAQAAVPVCTVDTTITANVVVFENPTVFNRLGAQNPNWISYALRRDVVQAANSAAIAANPALAATQGLPESQNGVLAPGQVELRRDKRPRPLVVRSVAGTCLDVNFQNLLAPIANPNNAQQGNLFNDDQVAGRCAGFHAQGVELRVGASDDGGMTGRDNDGDNVTANCTAGTTQGGLVGPGASIDYKLYTPVEGAFIINSYGAQLGSEASSGNTAVGMFGALNVEPVGSSIYRSQVTEEELRLATVGTVPTDCITGEIVGIDCNPGGQPVIDYEAVYPNVEPWISEGKAGLPILNMLTASGELVHSDINAIIAGDGPNGTFTADTYPLESVGKNNPQLPNRLEPFREFTSQFHDEQTNSQVFPRWYNDPVLGFTLAGVKDQFMINYGSGGIGSEIIANRLHTGPMHDCTDCAYEEFFLSSSTVGDPALLVNSPANTGIEQCDPTAIAGPTCWRDPVNLANGPIDGNFALYQEDPYNVHHAYLGDYTKIRNTHAGSFEQHIFHLHNQQWLFNPNDDNSNYLDAQEIMPGSGHTYELVNGGAGNRNKTVGDAIFHCHFYPHFAQGMWYHIRIKDVFERGTVLEVSNANDPQAPELFDLMNPQANFHTAPFALRSGKPAAGSRALPDGELPDGVPIPAIVPLPGKAMAPMPAKVQVAAVDRGAHSLLGGRTGPDGIPDSSQAFVDRISVAGADLMLGTDDDVSPGYPFWLAGNECGPEAGFADPAQTAANPDPDGNPLTPDAVCPNGIIGQRMPTPPLDMLSEAGATALKTQAGTTGMWMDVNPTQAGGWDGGLPRHSLLGYVSGGLSADTQSRLDFRKVIEMAPPVYFPEIGTDLEKVSMRFQAVRNRHSAANNLAGTGINANVDFIMNGAPPVPGGSYQDPCIDDKGARLLPDADGMLQAAEWLDGDGDAETFMTRGASEFHSQNPRTYKIANVQIDAVFNKVGYHYPQERIIALWEDVEPTINKQRPPEPLVMRFNTFDCGKLLHTNLVPHEYELDDFQVRTPTDIIGQHIHLPKWDLTTGDGAANGWNYEDGALAPGIVQERIHAINEFNHLAGTVVPAGTLPGQLAPIDLTDMVAVPAIDTGDPDTTTPVGATTLVAQPHPFFGAGVSGQDYLGARTVIQRILIDPVVNVAGVDRGLGLTFSHDHYGPSTFQQIGLYSTILAEPAGSTWVHNETGELLNTRLDGGPTTWQAAILPPAAAPNGSSVGSENIPDHREFYFEMSDFQHAYEPGVYVGADADGVPVLTAIIQPDPFNATVATAPALANTWRQTVNPPLKLKSVPFPDVVTAGATCPGPLADPVTGAPVPNSHTNASPFVPRPCAEAINISHSSMWVVNYRNEPVGLRVFDPSKTGPDGQSGSQADGQPGDLALAFQSRNDRKLPQLNSALGDTPYPTPGYCSGTGDGINCDRNKGDPFTPIMRAYEHDHVKIKVQVGATEEQHQTTFHGLKWLSNGSAFGAAPNSGWRNFQSTGISEQFSLQMPVLPDRGQRGNAVDYLYAQDATRDGIWGGTWGILRSYGNRQSDLFELPDSVQSGDIKLVDEKNFNGVCPKFEMDALGNVIDPPGKAKNTPIPVKQFTVYAVKANDVLPNDLGVTIPANTGGDSDGDGFGDNVGGPLNTLGGTLVYNRRGTVVPTITVPADILGGAPTVFQGGQGPLNDPTALMYVLEEDLMPGFIPGVSADINGDGYDDRCTDIKPNGDVNFALQRAGCPVVLKPEAPVEPMVLRANAGDCIEINLNNKLVNQAIQKNFVVPTDPLVFICDSVDEFGNCLALGGPIFDDVLALASLNSGKVLVNGDLQIVASSAAELGNIEFDTIPDLAGWQDLFWVVNRDMFLGNGDIKPVAQRRFDGLGNPQMHFFNNNLVKPSAFAGLHAQLVEYDASQDDGLVVGKNPQSIIARPGAQHTYRYYAGHVEAEYVRTVTKGKNTTREFRRVATPVEFGGTNLLSADRVKQPQKGLYGALVIEPAGSTVAEDTLVADGQGSGVMTRRTRAQVTVNAPVGGAGSGGTYREAIPVTYRIANLRWADGGAIANIHQGELGREGAEDSGHAGYNYGTEPSWFRFKLPSDVPFGNAGTPNSFGSIPNVHAFYANSLVAGEPNAIPTNGDISSAGDPATPVFRTTANMPTRLHVLNGASADRDATFVLHGHVWQRDPYVCPEDAYLTLPGMCDPDSVASQALGLNPIGKYMGGEEGMGHVYGHWPILFNAGGSYGTPADYLFRDYAPSGARNGMYGILRVEPDASP